MDVRVAHRSSSPVASSSSFLSSGSTSSRAWALLCLPSFLLLGANGIPHDHDEERTILLSPRSERFSTSEIIHDKYFIPAIVSMGVLLIFVVLCCFMLGWCFKRRDRHGPGSGAVWRPPLVNDMAQRRSLNNLNSRTPSRPLSGATSEGGEGPTLGRRSSKRKPAPAPAPNTQANLAPNAYQSTAQTPGAYAPTQQYNANTNAGVAPTQSHGFQPIQQTQPQFQVPMSVTPSRAGGYYHQQNPRMSAFSSGTSHTESSTQIGSGKTSPGAAGVGSGYGGGGGYFGTAHHTPHQQAPPQNYMPPPPPPPHSYAQQQPQPAYAQPQSYGYSQPQPQPTRNEQHTKYGTYATAEAYDGVVADSSPSGTAHLKADPSVHVAGSSTNAPAHPPPFYAGDSKHSDGKEIPKNQDPEKGGSR
ncbi:hypothetical protein M413DRAFT_447660 [Hebeloma cylindrosporum]|uniref:Uncharacterized protein n=1 Tax=Hebeloma cylindrosporum TaxID=76867 RepID=A0A0C3BQ02_HEBCY|nr:hypothetical protein M413DRAFT_447660 [Hebeloma cylindrosporum h7]